MINASGAMGFAAVSLVIALTPGPSWIYVISSTSRRSSTAGLVAVFGNATGILFHVVAAALGLSAALHYSATLFTTLKWIGSLYLIFLAIRIVRERARTVKPDETSDKKTLRKVFREGVLVNVFNPKVSLLMLALLPQFVDPLLGNTAIQLLVLGSLHILIASSVLSVLVAVVSLAFETFSQNLKLEAMFRWLTGTILFGFGAKIALSESP